MGTFFAELGARVIKIENPTTGGDMTRGWKLPSESKDSPTSAYYSSANWGKEVHFKDLKHPAEQGEVLHYIAQADIVISNHKPGSAQKLGIDPKTLRHQSPGLIYGWITGFGPDDDRTAYDMVLQAESGFLSMTGHPEGPPAKMPVALIDLMAAHQLKEGLLVALLNKATTGKGALVTVSLYDAALASLANQASNWLMEGHIPQRMGTQHPNIAPYGDCFTTADNKECILAIGTEAQFRNLCTLLKLSNLPQLPAYSSNGNRVKNRATLNRHLTQKIEQWPLNDLLDACREQRIPVAAVKNLGEVLNSPEAQALVLREEQHGRSTLRMRSAIFHIEE